MELAEVSEEDVEFTPEVMQERGMNEVHGKPPDCHMSPCKMTGEWR
jgi:hypothetical protein